ncbi:uncharacterized protein BJ171DRAFT_519304 [Polychytrium aggregatum]|uniref:uncharacterized protein n=1 Tax=Polychytrium aggregatum TaxID=110093 RepID=UPI0022FDFD0F|nr:uncharacterized protein BJ171DRAFT_519304 [Polychytrium aggregatum]KAI9199252.1 hypothetical protein BJ171DRAFT_519304 [Polychytrium aggregatum]
MASTVDRRFTTTGNELPGFAIRQNLGMVRGITVRNPNVGKAIIGGFAALAGGENSIYLEMAEKSRETAFVRLLQQAAQVGGNGVIGIRFDCQEVVQGMTEVCCYGTAVVIEKC